MKYITWMKYMNGLFIQQYTKNEIISTYIIAIILNNFNISINNIFNENICVNSSEQQFKHDAKKSTSKKFAESQQQSSKPTIDELFKFDLTNMCIK